LHHCIIMIYFHSLPCHSELHEGWSQVYTSHCLLSK
jgi:hypothetical protein